MSLGVDAFPRPAFFDDLGKIVKQGKAAAVLLLLDSDTETSARALAGWESLMPGVTVHAASMAGSAEPVAWRDTATEDSVRHIRLPHWMGHGLSQDDIEVLLHLKPVPDIVISCQAYDAHGEFVKTALEESLLPLVKRWNGLYLVHDPYHRVLRPQDSRFLKDRLRFRPKRLLFYHGFIRTLFAVGSIVSRITGIPKWRQIK